MRRALGFVVIFFILFISAIPYSAANTAFDRSLPRVVDDAKQLTSEQISELNGKLIAIAEKYGIDLAIVTVWDTDGKTNKEYSDDYFDYNGYGAGENHDGALLLINMGDRGWYFSTFRLASLYFTDSRIDKIMEIVLPYLSNGSAYAAFEKFIYECERYLSTGLTPRELNTKFDESGNPLPVWTDYIMGVFIASSVISIAIVTYFMSQLNNAKPKPYAGDYVRKNSFNLDLSRDIFLYSTVTKTRRQQENRSSSGGSSSSSGRSHGGHGGSF